MRCLRHAYDVMLLAYPPAFRRDFGREMAADVRRRLEELAERDSLLALEEFLLEIVSDWLRTVVREWLDETARHRAAHAHGATMISLFSENSAAPMIDNERSAHTWSLILACLGAFLLVEGWVRWFRAVGIWR